MLRLELTVIALLLSLPLSAASPAEQRLQEFYAAGATAANAERGALLWQQQHGDRACSSCHGERLVEPGSHVKTGKPIEPMAPSANAERYSDARKVDKWFRRNCKWTFGRECSIQEKADIMVWLNSL